MNIRNSASGLLLAVCAMAARGGDMSNSIEYTQLYITGDATRTSWDLEKAGEFARIGYGVFEWTGALEAGKEFKFMNTREAWHKHIVASNPQTTVAEGITVPLMFYADWALDGAKDCKFSVARSGTYTLTVDLTTMRMTMSEPRSATVWPSAFYLAGSATGGESLPLRDIPGVEFKGTFHLVPGFVRLTDSPVISETTTNWLPRYPEVDLTFGTGYLSPIFPSTDSSAKGWSVMVEGDYAVYLDKDSRSYMARRLTPCSELILVGGCCERAWNYQDESNCRFKPDPDDPFIMVWEGELRIGWDRQTGSDGSVTLPPEPDRFKILTAPDWFRDTYHPYTADAPAIGTTDARISGGDDLKWTIREDGLYRLELDTRTETLTGTFLGSADSGRSPSAGETAAIGSVATESAESDPERSVYYDLQGVRIPAPQPGRPCIRVDGSRAVKLIMP